jgi:hypothetical protein
MRGAAWLLAALLLSACQRAHGEPSAASIDAHSQPAQEAFDPTQRHLDRPRDDADVHYTPRAHYRVAARVLSRERYYLGWQSSLSPIDLALGWGTMSDPTVDQWVSWHQGGRWYFWQWDAGSPYRNEQIRADSANTHVIPGSDNLRRALLALDRGDVVQLQGWLVDIDGPGGAHWSTSLSRSDTGDNSCELLYVTELVAHGHVYR